MSLELLFTDRQEWGVGGAAVIQAEIVAGNEVIGLILDYGLADGLAMRGAADPAARLGGLRPGERRTERIPVAASRNGEFPVRLEAEVRLIDGRTIRIGQGATLRFGRPRPEGRQHNGAFEVRGKTLGELRR